MLDPLSDILATMRVANAITVRFESRGSYAMRFPAFEHLKFGALLFGSFELRPDNASPLRLNSGDCYLLTGGAPYATRSGNAPEMDGESYFRRNRDSAGVVRYGKGPPDKVVIGGRFKFDELGAQWLRTALPPLVHIPAEAPSAAPIRATLELLQGETGRHALGENLVIDRLADILLVQALRAHLAMNGENQVSWLAGLTDPRLGTALRAFHSNIAADWTVESLATEAGMSRSSFADHFRKRTGLAPIEYVSRWRLFRIRRVLLATDRPFATIAADHGWQSRTSCSRAFRELFGATPHQLRIQSSCVAGTTIERGDFSTVEDAEPLRKTG